MGAGGSAAGGPGGSAGTYPIRSRGHPDRLFRRGRRESESDRQVLAGLHARPGRRRPRHDRCQRHVGRRHRRADARRPHQCVQRAHQQHPAQRGHGHDSRLPLPGRLARHEPRRGFLGLVSDRRGGRRRQRRLLDRVPGQHRARRGLRSRSRVRHRRGDRRRDAGRQGDAAARALHEPAAPPAVGPRAGGLRRGPLPYRPARLGVGGGHSRAHPGQRQALHGVQHREPPQQQQLEPRRADAARDLCAPLPDGRAGQRRRFGDGVVQPHQRREGDAEQPPSDQGPPRRFRVSGLRAQRLVGDAQHGSDEGRPDHPEANGGRGGEGRDGRRASLGPELRPAREPGRHLGQRPGPGRSQQGRGARPRAEVPLQRRPPHRQRRKGVAQDEAT